MGTWFSRVGAPQKFVLSREVQFLAQVQLRERERVVEMACLVSREAAPLALRLEEPCLASRAQAVRPPAF